MRRRRAAIGSLLFLLVAPGTVAGLVPWWLTGWVLHDWPQPSVTPLRLVGAVPAWRPRLQPRQPRNAASD